MLEPVIDGTHVRCLHAWQGRHDMLITEPVEIEDIISSFHHLTGHDWVEDSEYREEHYEQSEDAFKVIFGEQDAEVPMQIDQALSNGGNPARNRPLIGFEKGHPSFIPGEDDASETLARLVSEMDHPVLFSLDGELVQITR